MYVFVKRNIPFAFALYYIGFAVFGYGSNAPVGIIDYTEIAIFLFGSYLNTFSKYQQHIWNKDSENNGKLYTIKLFKYSIHINYFVVLFWVLGYTILTHNIYSFWIPVFLYFFFSYFNIPKNKYQEEKYKERFSDYKKQKKIIPFIY